MFHWQRKEKLREDLDGFFGASCHLLWEWNRSNLWFGNLILYNEAMLCAGQCNGHPDKHEKYISTPQRLRRRCRQTGTVRMEKVHTQQFIKSMKKSWVSLWVCLVPGTSHLIFRTAQTSLSKAMNPWLHTLFKSLWITKSDTTKLGNATRTRRDQQ